MIDGRSRRGPRVRPAQGDYAALAEFWTCFFGDRGVEVAGWATLARRYGRRVLAPMAAVGELAHGLARAGFEVVAVDRSAAMVREGRRRFPPVETLAWMRADVRRLRLAGAPFDFAFLANGDLHHFAGRDVQAGVLARLAQTLRLEIAQTLHVLRAGGEERHPHRLSLHLLPRDDVPAVLEQAGLRWAAEYGSADLAPWTPGAATWIVLAERA